MVALLVRLGLSQARAARLAPFALAAALIALVAVSVTAFEVWRLHDNAQAVTQDRAQGNADFREKQVTAERNAGAAKAERDEGAHRDLDKLKDKIDEADRNGTSAADDVWSNGLWD